ncbi:glycerol-3-phosphate acyltransferase [Chlorella sorokiniana]|jgi:hypothetical protein|uniref:Glycerol-3-phosphate acyltransferase n=1 Tax=Chlorella sorokiniana TaxID=3076 RepID=A0A2P6U4F2_CHLSO|nr:glycerol-3-phosphate acyltransferase [Chlorella sorokiniana]|eukprot:PRW61186.1 glycerol-3-phosphate acyltransferase [Chlorella sorokiniana]
MRAAHLLLALLGLSAAFCSRAAGSTPTADQTQKLLLSFVADLQQFASGQEAGGRRRLQTLSTMNAMIDRQQARMESVQEFFQDMMGSSWRDWVPFNWTLPSFDWSHLGEFDYSSNLGDFLDAHSLKNMTNVHSVKDVANSWEEIEAAFCDKEDFTHSVKVPAKCVGPSVTIALVPKVCILDSKSKQILCDPAKLVLTKTPGSCTHKYKSASTWVGHECKITGGAGFSKEETIGGGNRTIPLIDIEIGYEA